MPEITFVFSELCTLKCIYNLTHNPTGGMMIFHLLQWHDDRVAVCVSERSFYPVEESDLAE